MVRLVAAKVNGKAVPAEPASLATANWYYSKEHPCLSIQGVMVFGEIDDILCFN